MSGELGYCGWGRGTLRSILDMDGEADLTNVVLGFILAVWLMKRTGK